MMQKILHFDIDDIVVDPDNVLERIEHACSETTGRYRLRGICQIDDRISFVLVPLEASESAETYQFGWLDDTTPEGVQTALMNRWSGGYDTIGCVNLGDNRYMLVLAAVQS